jgi:ankyrin repeat protein
MSALHAHFHLRNQHAFQRALEGSRAAAPSAGAGGAAPPGSSGGKSWTRAGHLKDAMAPAGPPADVNTRDWLGRTVLHLACAATDNAAVEYVRMLLAHPAVNVNLQDRESNWTALHRALYHGNLASA